MQKQNGEFESVLKYTITKRFEFSSAHQLMYHDGKCAKMHGHNFVLEVSVSSNRLYDTTPEYPPYHPKSQRLVTDHPKKNMVMDFGDLKDIVKPLVESLDHEIINEVLEEGQPTAELLAEFFYRGIQEKLNELEDSHAEMDRVRVYETSDSWAEVSASVRVERTLS